MKTVHRVLKIHFYQEDSGRVPVREWLHELPKSERKKIGYKMKLVQFGWPIGMPLVRHLQDDLWEVRCSLENRIARVIFLLHGLEMVLLHALIKKTQKLPPEDLAIAQKRAKRFLYKKGLEK